MIFKAIELDEITKGGKMDREKGQDLSLEVLQHLTVRYSNEDQEEPTSIRERRWLVLNLRSAN